MSDLGWRKRRPRGWVGATAHARRHRTHHPARGFDPEGGETVLDPADVRLLLDVDWEVHPPGAAPFTLREVARPAPLWVDASSTLGGRGRRFWSVRVRPTQGLLPEVALPCLLPPERADDIWIDWDAAYAQHVPVWDRMTAVDREVRLRRGGIDALAERALSPFRPSLDPADAPRVEERLAAEDRAWDDAVAATAAARDGDAAADLAGYRAEAARLRAAGREAHAVIVSAAPTGAVRHGLPEWAIELDVHDLGEVRRVLRLEPLGRPSPPWTPGLRTTVRVDPDDPEVVVFA